MSVEAAVGVTSASWCCQGLLAGGRSGCWSRRCLALRSPVLQVQHKAAYAEVERAIRPLVRGNSGPTYTTLRSQSRANQRKWTACIMLTMIGLRVASFLVVAAFALSAVACGDDDESSPSATATRSPAHGTPTRSATASPSPEPFEGGRDPVQVTPVPGGPTTALLRDVRIADQGTFDRITLEFEGGLPGYSVQYVEPPIIADASGLEVDIEGSAFIQIRMEPAAGHDPNTGEETYTGELELKSDLPSILEVERTGDFEAVLTWVLGLSEEADFRVTTIEGPPRLVVDVAHP